MSAIHQMIHPIKSKAKPFYAGTAKTPFTRVHLAASQEMVNELNCPICSFQIDGNPQETNRQNAAEIVRRVNAIDELETENKRLLACVKLALKSCFYNGSYYPESARQVEILLAMGWDFKMDNLNDGAREAVDRIMR